MHLCYLPEEFLWVGSFEWEKQSPTKGNKHDSEHDKESGSGLDK